MVGSSRSTRFFANEVFRNRGLADVPYGLAHDMVMNFLPAQRFLQNRGIRANHKSARPSFPRGKGTRLSWRRCRLDAPLERASSGEVRGSDWLYQVDERRCSDCAARRIWGSEYVLRDFR